MPRRSLHEDTLLTTALFLETELHKWGMGDLTDAASMITGGAVIENHVVTRALRKFKNESWVTAERDPDQSMGPRLLYEITEDLGVPAALKAAGRELAAGKTYPITVISKFGATATGLTIVTAEIKQ